METTHSPTAAHECLYSSLEPSDNGKLRRDETEEAEGLAPFQSALSKQAGRVFD